MKRSWRLILGGRLAVLSLSLAMAPSASAAEKPSEVRLYALDCGRMEFKNLAPFSDTGEYEGKAGTLVDPCFLIAHPKGYLLWDAGLGDAMLGKPVEKDELGGLKLEVTKSFRAQLKELGLTPADITFFAFSHAHFDHTGNAQQLTNATWIVQKAEWASALGHPTPGGVVPQNLALPKTAKKEEVRGDHDVFGDGKVQLLSTPGHTPGHQALMVKLAKSGTVILSGDLYHQRDNFTYGRVPSFNDSRSETLASENRIERILKLTHGRLVVQHDAGDFKALPKFPAALK